MTRHDPRHRGADRLSRRAVLAASGTLLASGMAGCLDGNGGGSGGGNGDDMDGGNANDEMDSTDDGSDETAAWRTTELATVRGESQFSIDALEPPVVVQSFAVWCPKCEQQSREIVDLADSLTVVGLNTDPNEDASKVRQHAEDNGFDWRFAVAPTEMTDSLVDQFGPSVTNAPSTPVIVACGDGTAEFNSGSIESAAEVRSTADGC